MYIVYLVVISVNTLVICDYSLFCFKIDYDDKVKK